MPKDTLNFFSPAVPPSQVEVSPEQYHQLTSVAKESLNFLSKVDIAQETVGHALATLEKSPSTSSRFVQVIINGGGQALEIENLKNEVIHLKTELAANRVFLETKIASLEANEAFLKSTLAPAINQTNANVSSIKDSIGGIKESVTSAINKPSILQEKKYYIVGGIILLTVVTAVVLSFLWKQAKKTGYDEGKKTGFDEGYQQAQDDIAKKGLQSLR